MKESLKSQQANPSPGYEKTDLSFKWVMISLGIMGVTAVLIHLGLGGLQVLFARQWPGQQRVEGPWSRAPHQEFQSFPAPALQTAPKLDMARFSAQEEQELNRYAWIDREKQVLRIPISQAMDLLVKQGRQVWGTNHPPSAQKSNLQLIQERTVQGEEKQKSSE